MIGTPPEVSRGSAVKRCREPHRSRLIGADIVIDVVIGIEKSRCRSPRYVRPDQRFRSDGPRNVVDDVDREGAGWWCRRCRPRQSSVPRSPRGGVGNPGAGSGRSASPLRSASPRPPAAAVSVPLSLAIRTVVLPILPRIVWCVASLASYCQVAVTPSSSPVLINGAFATCDGSANVTETMLSEPDVNVSWLPAEFCAVSVAATGSSRSPSLRQGRRRPC